MVELRYKKGDITMPKIKETELDKISGGQEPEEFDWKSKGYTTPIKEDDKKGWTFKAIGQIENVFNKLFNK